jgi:hypothetical protein
VTLHAQALVLTGDASAVGARVAGELAGEYETEWSAEAGSVRLPEGRCELHSWPEALRLDAYAETEGGLGRVETVVAETIGRVTGTGPATVDWYRRRG